MQRSGAILIQKHMGHFDIKDNGKTNGKTNRGGILTLKITKKLTKSNRKMTNLSKFGAQHVLFKVQGVT